MAEFNCTVKDIFRRANMIDKTVRKLADNGYPEYAVTYSVLRDNICNALEYAAANMKDYEYMVAMAYLESHESEEIIAKKTFYTHRTIRRYVRRACDLIGEYYADILAINLLPADTRSVTCMTVSGSFWQKVNSLMSSGIENACAVILCCNEHRSVNFVCQNYGMGSLKVRRIVSDFEAAATVYDIPSENRCAV